MTKRPWILLAVILFSSCVFLQNTQRNIRLVVVQQRALDNDVMPFNATHEESLPIINGSKKPSTNNNIKKSEKKKKKKCVPMASWQQQSHHHPSCNMFHELSMDNEALLITSGSYRNVWKILEYNGTPRVVKTLAYQRTFDTANFHRHLRDAVALEQLSSSPHVVDIYGYCSNSALVDYTSDGDLTRLHMGGRNYTKRELLAIAQNVAASIADAHFVHPLYQTPTMAHADIKPNQFLNFNGKFQLNDFNRAHFLKWNTESKTTCGFTETKNGGAASMSVCVCVFECKLSPLFLLIPLSCSSLLFQWRSPEEYLYQPETAAIDVYSLGHVLNFILTAQVPFPHLTDKQVAQQVSSGHRVQVTDPTILKSTHPYDRALLQVLDMCFEFDPAKRASARQVTNVLRDALDKLSSMDNRER